MASALFDVNKSKLQLKEVEAAIALDPTSSELKKLRDDLLQIIKLTADLAPASSGAGSVAVSSSGKKWRVGDYCLGVWLEDGNYYDARIDAIADDSNTVTITYLEYGNSAAVSVNSLREMPAGSVERHKRSIQEVDGSDASGSEEASTPSSSEPGAGAGAARSGKKPRTAADVKAAKEAKVVKLKERKQRMEELTQAREQEKKGWQSFASKSKAVTKKSIFASPDNPNGKVGVGTCGIGGKPPTEVTHKPQNWAIGLKKDSSSGASGASADD